MTGLGYEAFYQFYKFIKEFLQILPFAKLRNAVSLGG